MTAAPSGKKPTVVCITGPTACGKTAAAVCLCEKLGGEAISMDSMQIYQRMTIGTAKPTPEEMRGVPHHMLSVVPPEIAYTVADYQRDAWRAMEDVLVRGKLPVFVGGTGLYLQAVSHPLGFAQAPADAGIRKALQEEALQPGGAERLHARLSAIDPITAERLPAGNLRRVVRALEVYEATGVPMSARLNDWGAEPAQNWHIFALRWPREALYRRIDARAARMVQAGLLDEVRGLIESGVPREAQALQAIGYKEMLPVLDGACTKEEATALIQMRSRRYAKRQMTWLRRDVRVQWLDVGEGERAEGVAERIAGMMRPMPQ
jgi:tRNA dimethylallyltransferase